MVSSTTDLWSLVKYRPEIDPDDLAEAIQEELDKAELDYRTRLLLRDSLEALRQHWGAVRFGRWASDTGLEGRIARLCQEFFDRPGFPSLARRLMDKLDPEEIRRFLRELGSKVHGNVRLLVGGSVALILPGYLHRGTDDIDIVDEVPADIRTQHALMHDLEKRYGLKLAHFQRHYLPMGWEQRLHYLDRFGQIQVYLLDVYDIALSKLFSIRTKDLDDLRLLTPQLDKETLKRRLLDTTVSMLAAESLHKRAADNWYILYGEPLPA